MSVVWAILLVLVLAVCWLLTLLGMPGNWFMVAAAAGYALLAPTESPLSIGWATVIALLVLAAIGELLEFLAGAAGVTKAGGSKRGAALALAGSIAGGVTGLFVGVPIPVVGPILGAVLLAGAGAFIGAVLGEQWKGREDRTSTSDRKADPFLLRSLLRILPLIVQSIGHGKREAIDQLGMAAVPEPIRIGLLLQLLGNFDGQIVQGLLGELGSCATIVPRVGRWRRPPAQLLVGDHCCHSGLTGRSLFVPEHLAQERPQDTTTVE